MRKLFGGSMIVALLVGIALPAASRQLDASDRPQRSGPLRHDGGAYEGPDCRSDKATFNGEVTARYETCSFFYRFNPARESNANRDFGALWLQAELDPDNGWCASEVKVKLELLDASTRVQDATEREASPASSKWIVAKLRVDAGGAPRAGKLHHRFKLYAGEFSSVYRNKRDRLRISWDGATRRTVAFAGGIAISWRTNEGPPPVAIDIEPVMQDRC